MITDLFDPSPSTATSLLPQVKIAREQGGSGGGFGAALLDALVGSSGADPLTKALASVHVHLAPAPILPTCRLQFLPQGDFPTLTPGQSITVHLGFDEEPPAIYTGPIAAIGLRQAAVEVLLGSPANALARSRRNSGYENQSFSDLLQLWANEHELEAGDIDSGPDYAFIAIDDRLSLWDWMARLARHAGVPVWVGADGRLNARAPRGQPVATWKWGQDILALDATARDPATTSARMVGEGSAGRQGSDAWSWLAKNPQGLSASAGAGGGASLGQDGALRDLAAVAGAASAQAQGAAQLTDLVRVTVPGTPALEIAGIFALADTPGGFGAGQWAAREIRHRFSAAKGFTTEIVGVAL